MKGLLHPIKQRQVATLGQNSQPLGKSSPLIPLAMKHLQVQFASSRGLSYGGQ